MDEYVKGRTVYVDGIVEGRVHGLYEGYVVVELRQGVGKYVYGFMAGRAEGDEILEDRHKFSYSLLICHPDNVAFERRSYGA